MERLNEIESILKEAEGYQIIISVLKNAKLSHHLMTESFPLGDMLTSHQETKKLIVAELEKK